MGVSRKVRGCIWLVLLGCVAIVTIYAALFYLWMLAHPLYQNNPRWPWLLAASLALLAAIVGAGLRIARRMLRDAER